MPVEAPMFASDCGEYSLEDARSLQRDGIYRHRSTVPECAVSPV